MRNLFPLLLLAACSSTTTIGGDTAGGNDTAGGDTGVPSPDFCGAKQIFNDHCTVCHSASGHKGDLDLETDPYSALVGVQSARRSAAQEAFFTSGAGQVVMTPELWPFHICCHTNLERASTAA